MLTVALAAVRTRWSAFAGTCAVLALGVPVIAAVALALALAPASAGGPHQPPERLTASLGAVAVASAVAVVTVTAAAFALSVERRRRELALLRVIGATSRQVMGMICAEAATVGAAGSAVGSLLALKTAPMLAGWITGRGLAPSWFGADPAAALAAAFAVGVVVTIASAGVAALRAGTIRPAEALLTGRH